MLPAFHPHYDVWALAFALAFGYWYADRRLARCWLPMRHGRQRARSGSGMGQSSPCGWSRVGRSMT